MITIFDEPLNDIIVLCESFLTVSQFDLSIMHAQLHPYPVQQYPPPLVIQLGVIAVVYRYAIIPPQNSVYTKLFSK